MLSSRMIVLLFAHVIARADGRIFISERKRIIGIAFEGDAEGVFFPCDESEHFSHHFIDEGFGTEGDFFGCSCFLK